MYMTGDTRTAMRQAMRKEGGWRIPGMKYKRMRHEITMSMMTHMTWGMRKREVAGALVYMNFNTKACIMKS